MRYGPSNKRRHLFIKRQYFSEKQIIPFQLSLFNNTGYLSAVFVHPFQQVDP